MKTTCSFFLTTIILSVMATGCHSGVEKAPEGSEYNPLPMFDRVDPKEVVEAAKKSLNYPGNMLLLSMDGEMKDESLPEIVGEFSDSRSRGEPVVCVSQDVRFIANAWERALAQVPHADFSGAKMIVAAPTEPSEKFQALLDKRKIQYFYLHWEPKGPYKHGG